MNKDYFSIKINEKQKSETNLGLLGTQSRSVVSIITIAYRNMLSTLFVHNLKLAIVVSCLLLVVSSNTVSAEVPTLSKVRVTYRPDGGVSVTSFIGSACQSEETETECMDREMQKNPELANLPHDDVFPSQLPQDRKDRNKWVGSKGQGIQIDHSLVTKAEKIEELENQLDEELNKNNPNSVKVAKLQRKLEKVKKLNDKPGERPGIISPEELAKLDNDQNQSFLASVVETVSSAVSSVFDSLLTSIQNGFLALKELVTDTLKVGSPEKPAGITIYDQTTKQPYCLIIKDGQMQNLPGECGSQPVSAPAPVQEPAPAPEPDPVTEPSLTDETASSTPQ